MKKFTPTKNTLTSVNCFFLKCYKTCTPFFIKMTGVSVKFENNELRNILKILG